MNPIWQLGKEVYSQDKDFTRRSALNLEHIRPRTRFKATAHPLPNGTHWMNYWARLGQGVRENMLSDK